MSTARDQIESAFARLAGMEGFTEREDQRQLALLLSDLISERSTGAFEAPTGLGKSLAALIPAIAHAATDRKRVVIATYTNVLAEQYWRRDLPLAQSLFEGESVRTQFLIGRQRYVCLAALEERSPALADRFARVSELGVETEFRESLNLKPSEVSRLWKEVAIPAVCPARLCPRYNACHYYRARRQAERAEVVITNHSVVIQDALLKRSSLDGKGLLGDFDFLIVDEAHDLVQAAAAGLEIELSERTLSTAGAIANRIGELGSNLAQQTGEGLGFSARLEKVQHAIERAKKDLIGTSLMLIKPGILRTAPGELQEHAAVKEHSAVQAEPMVEQLADALANEIEEFAREASSDLSEWAVGGCPKDSLDSMGTYLAYLEGFAHSCRDILTPHDVAVSHVSRNGADTAVRLDVIDLTGPLRELLWGRSSWACMSATLALDGSFDHFKRTTGAEPTFEEILPTPFDFGTQSALYLPPVGTVPDPTLARKQGTEDGYFRAVAGELSTVIEKLGGRTLALFHSRRELEGVYDHMALPEDLPLHVQSRSGAGSAGERFRAETRSSLFALRSLWTGFDAPGETLSCVVLVRVPFEVPVDPTAVARMAWLQSRGEDPFAFHTLPNAKMLMRQGSGRLIRTATDKGLVVIIDPRIRTKRYGEEILSNLPPTMRTYDNLERALEALGLDSLVGVSA